MTEPVGKRLQAARKRAGYRTQQELGDLVGVSGRQIRNYEAGRPPPPDVLQKLREYVGEYDAEGDPVELAIQRSDLVGFRQTKVIGYYQEQLHDQQRDERGA